MSRSKPAERDGAGHAYTHTRDLLYTEGAVLGKGTFGVVRFARHIETGEQLVIKKVPVEPSCRKEVWDEVDVLRSLQHPHICRIVDAWERDGYLHIVMPFYELGDLMARLKEDPHLTTAEVTPAPAARHAV